MTNKKAEINEVIAAAGGDVQENGDQQNRLQNSEYQRMPQGSVGGSSDVSRAQSQTGSTGITKETYGDNYQAHLLEQYKLYVEMTDNISARRNKMNSFYTSLLSGLLAFLSLTGEKAQIAPQFRDIILLAVAILGMILCFLWYVNIQSYKQLNSGKFKVIYEMEQYLPFACYDKEWNILRKDKSHGGYLNHTRIEQYIPLALATVYLGLLIYSILSLLK
ncbi:MAG: hypothetical protein JOZ78_10520 [Chroococcidiopsidaceae cyanobacterium CP_BM_ER_R8_30]|nr:hypothetical protein [Chroococcidiopsidaceae cyanobacterium CP_BM_ER_R8_30]